MRILQTLPHLLKDPPARETLDGLRRVGFRLNTGIDGSGFILLAWSKAGGYYFGAISTALLF